MSGTSKYQQVADWVRGRLEAGTLRPGDRLETETEIAQRVSYSRPTVRQAPNSAGKPPDVQITSGGFAITSSYSSFHFWHCTKETSSCILGSQRKNTINTIHRRNSS